MPTIVAMNVIVHSEPERYTGKVKIRHPFLVYNNFF